MKTLKEALLSKVSSKDVTNYMTEEDILKYLDNTYYFCNSDLSEMLLNRDSYTRDMKDENNLELLKKRVNIYKKGSKYVVDVNCDVHVRPTVSKLTNDKIQINKIEGSLYILQNKNITLLHGCPNEVTKVIRISECPNIKSLKGCSPTTGAIWCDKCGLTTLEGITNTKIIIVENCDNIKNLKGSPSILKVLICRNCKNLTSLTGAPKKVEQEFQYYNIPIKSLKGAPEEIGTIYCQNCNDLVSLEGLHIINDHIIFLGDPRELQLESLEGPTLNGKLFINESLYKKIKDKGNITKNQLELTDSFSPGRIPSKLRYFVQSTIEDMI